MKQDIEYSNGLIIIKAILSGKKEHPSRELRLGLDTASDRTIIIPPYIKAIGYSENDKTKNIDITTGSSTVKAYELNIYKTKIFNFSIRSHNVIVKDFPLGLYFIGGLLGLDFFQKIKKELILDFNNNTIEIK